MAACHPKLKTHPGAELFLSRFADGDWRGIVRPWLLAGRGTLERSIVVAPTRGQTQALKQRCVSEGVALLGVEFLTPGLARKKRGGPDGMGRSLQVLVLRSIIEERLAALAEICALVVCPVRDNEAQSAAEVLDPGLLSDLAHHLSLLRKQAYVPAFNTTIILIVHTTSESVGQST